MPQPDGRFPPAVLRGPDVAMRETLMAGAREALPAGPVPILTARTRGTPAGGRAAHRRPSLPPAGSSRVAR